MTATHWDARLLRFSRAGAVATALVGGMVLVGWFFDVPLLKRGLPGLVTMKANTAVAFMGVGVSLWLHHSAQGRTRRVGGLLLAAAVIAVALVTLAEDLLGVDAGVDELLFRDNSVMPGASRGGRMSPVAAVNFILTGAALICLHLGSERPRRWVPASAVLVMLLGALALIGYAFGVDSLYRIGIYTSMAVHTAATFCLLAVSLLAAVPTVGFMETVTSETAGGFVARRLLLLIPVSLFGLGWVCVVGEYLGWFDGRFGLVLMVLLSMVFSAGLVLWHARVLYRVDRLREQANAEIVTLNASLERKVQARTHELQTALAEVKQLTGLLPVCAWCKKIRDDQDYWLSVEDFIATHTDARLSHGMCPTCYAKYLEDHPDI